MAEDKGKEQTALVAQQSKQLSIRASLVRRGLQDISDWSHQRATADEHFLRGLGLHDQGDLDGAIAEYRAALLLNPDSEHAQSNLSAVLKSLSDSRQT